MDLKFLPSMRSFRLQITRTKALLHLTMALDRMSWSWRWLWAEEVLIHSSHKFSIPFQTVTAPLFLYNDCLNKYILGIPWIQILDKSQSLNLFCGTHFAKRWQTIINFRKHKLSLPIKFDTFWNEMHFLFNTSITQRTNLFSRGILSHGGNTP